ncbi:ATP-dependent endonuclease [Rhizobium ruizarguesonis]
MLIKSLEFSDYKTYPHFVVSAKAKNVLVGPNNIGKSTALDALRIAFDVLRFANRRKPELKSHGPDGVCATYMVPPTVVQTDLRYCVHNFDDGPARIQIKIDDGSTLKMNIPSDGDLECYLVSDVRVQKMSGFLRRAFPLDIVIVPTLSPLEQNEEFVQEDTVERNRFGRLASRNFRSFWYRQPNDEFEKFADLVEMGWPGLRIRKPEIERADGKLIARMYFRDGPNVREVQWSGFGFQVWMQTMMHLRTAGKDSVLVLDEPDVYLHPDLQHRLLKIVTQRVGQYFIATHSTEIINDVDPTDVLILRPGARSAKRIRSEEAFASVYDAIGSSENAQFARLARTKKVLYVEGHDTRLLAKLGKVIGGSDFLSDSSVTLMKTDGFSNWSRVATSAWVFNQFFEFDVKVASVFDRDYRCDADVQEFIDELKGSDVLCFVLPFKEIENLLLVPEAIRKVVAKYGRADLPKDWETSFDAIFRTVIDSFKDRISNKTAGKLVEFELSKNPKRDVPTLFSTALDDFLVDWKEPEFRRKKVPGKEAFSLIAKEIQDRFAVTVTASRVIDEFAVADVHPQVRDMFKGLENFFEG